MDNKIEELSYEEGLEKLNLILNNLDNDELTLEESMSQFKLGVEIYKHLNQILEKTEGEIKILLDEENNIERDFLRGE